MGSAFLVRRRRDIETAPAPTSTGDDSAPIRTGAVAVPGLLTDRDAGFQDRGVDHSRSPLAVIRRMQSPVEEQVGAKGTTPKGQAGQVVLKDVVIDQASDKAQVVLKGSAELLSILNPVLLEYLAGINYNSLEDAAAYAGHLTKARSENPETTPQEAFATFTPNSLQPIASVFGAQCVGQAIDFAVFVSKKTGLPAYATAAQFAERLQYGHAAVLLKFKNPAQEDDCGFILMDPGFNADEPLVITPTTSAKLRKFVYRWNPDKAKIENVADTGKVVVTFDVLPVANPDPAVARNALMSYKTFTVVTRGRKTDIILILDLRGNLFTLKRGSKSFKAGLDEIVKIKGLISAEVAEALGYGKGPEGAGRLLTSLNAVIQAKNDLITLQDSAVVMEERNTT